MSGGPLRLVLGTAQLGMPYGIANTTGMPDPDQAREIIRVSYERGIRDLDTAQGYGESEAVVGESLRNLGLQDAVRVVTKLHPDLEGKSYRRLRDEAERSIERLGVRRLWGLMLHREEQLDRWGDLYEGVLGPLRESALVEHVGVSVYSPERALQAMSCYGLDIIQGPGNVFDRRLLRDGVFARARRARIHVHVRSIYLQGLVLMRPEDLPMPMEFAAPALKAYGEFCRRFDLHPGEFALRYGMSRFCGAELVVGMESTEHVDLNVRWAAAAGDEPEALCDLWDEEYRDFDDALIDPSRWPTPQ